MSLAPGTRLGPYEIVSPLGAGAVDVNPSGNAVPLVPPHALFQAVAIQRQANPSRWPSTGRRS